MHGRLGPRFRFFTIALRLERLANVYLAYNIPKDVAKSDDAQ